MRSSRNADVVATAIRKEIPYVNIAAQHRLIKEKLLKALERVVDHGQFVLGEEVNLFEERFAKLCGVRYTIGLNSGTDALILALHALGVGATDEVITVPNSFISSTSCIRIVGARPVFVDVGEDYNIDVEKIEYAITPKTKAILPVHFTGRPADMDRILAVARRYNLYVIEDCAQAALAQYRNKSVGSFGNLGCFSLHPLKTLNACGDGGVVTTDDEKLYQRLKILRNLGLENRDNCVTWSGNSRLDTIQAAALLVKMDYVWDWTEKRRENAAFYRRRLTNTPVRCPIDKPYERAVYHTFVIQAERRDELKEYLTKQGIGTAIHYPIPIHLQSVSAELGYGHNSFPVAESQSRRILSLPVYPEMNDEDIDYVCYHIKQFYGVSAR